MLVLLSLLACKPEAPVAPPPGAVTDAGERVFTVNGMVVGQKELDLVFALMKIPESQRAEFAKTSQGRHVAEEYAAATVLYQKAVETKLYERPDVALELAFAARQVLGARMRAELAQTAVSDAAIQKWYDDNKNHFTQPEAKTRQILVGELVLANDLLERLQKGEKFADLAKAHSLDSTSKDRGGELGWIKLADPTIGQVLTHAVPGQYVGPVETRLGFHILQVDQKRDFTPIEDVRDAAAVQLANDEAVRQIDAIRKTMVIEWKDPPPPASEKPPVEQLGLPPMHPPAGGDPHGERGGGGH